MIELIKELQSMELLKDFILAGGTALSLQLEHRKSVDIDLFSTSRHDYNRIFEYLCSKYNNVNVVYRDEGTLQIKINGIKVDLVSIKGNMLEPPINDENIVMFGVKDIAAMKLLAIQGRKKPKDYADVAYLIETIGLNEMLECYKKRYDKENIIDVKKALSNTNELNPYEWEKVEMIRNDIPLSMVKRVIDDALLAHEKEYRKNKKHGFNIKKLFGSHFNFW